MFLLATYRTMRFVLFVIDVGTHSKKSFQREYNLMKLNLTESPPSVYRFEPLCGPSMHGKLEVCRVPKINKI